MVKSRKFIYLFSIIIVLAISIGYAALGSEMSLSNLVAEVRIKEDIRITDVSVYSTEGSPNYNYVKYDKDSIISYFSMNAGDSITFKIEITNIENAEMGILNLSGLPDGVSYSFGNSYTEKEKLCNDAGLCNLGMVKEIYLTITSDSTSISGNEYSIDFNFQPFYTVSYDSSITNNGYPTEIIGGGDLVITFTEPVPSSVSVFSNGLEVDSSLYTYENNVLTYNNVSGHIVIKNNTPKTLYSIMQMATTGLDTNIDFSKVSSATNGDGINTVSGTENDEYPIYYYRGAVENNNVLFAGKCWKAVRTTDTGGVKLILYGINDTCVEENVIKYNVTDWYNPDYEGPLGDYSDYLKYTNSRVQSMVDFYYQTHLTEYTYFLEDIKWCNEWDSSVVQKRFHWDGTASPSITCDEKYQLFVAAENADNKLEYPTAILTADEVIFAGGLLFSGSKASTYLNYNLNIDQWTMTSYNDSEPPFMLTMDSNGTLWDMEPNQVYNFRPMISVSDKVKVKRGNGTATNPYILEVPNLITFTINATTYYAEEGMTWSEWIESEYNDGTVWLDNEFSTSTSVCHNLAVVYYNNTSVSHNSFIISGGLYHTDNVCAPI